MPEILVKFNCRKCGLKAAGAYVREREAGESIAHWLDSVVMPKIASSHRLASPSCAATACDVLAPMTMAPDGVTVQIGRCGRELTAEELADVKARLKVNP